VLLRLKFRDPSVFVIAIAPRNLSTNVWLLVLSLLAVLLLSMRSTGKLVVMAVSTEAVAAYGLNTLVPSVGVFIGPRRMAT
jgi:hypothetical protein